MARKINPILIRAPFLRTWQSLWHSSYNYPILFQQELFLKKYLKTVFSKYSVYLVDLFVKRTFNCLFFTIVVFNKNSRSNTQFKPFLFLRKTKFLKVVLDQEIKRLTLTMLKLTGSSRIIFNFKFIKNQKSNIDTAIRLAKASLVQNFCLNLYAKMNSYGKILQTIKKSCNNLVGMKTNLKGIKIQISGPVRAPRTRRSQTIKALYFGTTPIATYGNFIDYSVKTRSLEEGVITMKLWIFKKQTDIKLLEFKSLVFKLLSFINLYRNFQRENDFKIFRYFEFNLKKLNIWRSISSENVKISKFKAVNSKKQYYNYKKHRKF